MFGSDSKFRGMNISLVQSGQGTANLQWQYWDGSAWAHMDGPLGNNDNFAFTDTTNDLTRSGNLSWSDPKDWDGLSGRPKAWKPYSVNGGPDLYYVRAFLPANFGTYSTLPQESQVRTDIALVQYCGDVNTIANFNIQAPVTTAVKIASFRAVGFDSVVSVEWETATELDNLGFHLYRGLRRTALGAADADAHPRARLLARGQALLLPRLRPAQRGDVLLPPRGPRPDGPGHLARSGLGDSSGWSRSARRGRDAPPAQAEAGPPEPGGRRSQPRPHRLPRGPRTATRPGSRSASSSARARA